MENLDREIFIFAVQLTTSRIGNLTRLILTLTMCDDHTYIPVYTVVLRPNVTKLSSIQARRVFCFCFVWCPCMAINVSVQYNGGFLPDIILFNIRYYHRGI